MGKCEFCGKPAGIFKKLHKECKEEQELLKEEYHDPGIDEFRKSVALFNLRKASQKLSQKSSKKSSCGTANIDLDGEFAMIEDYEEIHIDEHTKNKIKVLKETTDSIESKLLSITDTNPKKIFKIDYESELNSQQFAAVTALGFPLLVIAGAGSGKTRVITYKVSYLIENGLSPSEILLLTFTRKAANEMLARVQKLLGGKSLSGVLGGTFHGFSNHMLRRHSRLIGIPNNFTIIDAEDAKDIIGLLRTELNLSSKKESGCSFPQKGMLHTIISKAINLELTIGEVIHEFFDVLEKFTKDIELINQAFSEYKKASNILDYDDLMDVLRDKLKENEIFRKKLQDEIKYILVDEYQDINNIQREIVEYIAGEEGKLTVVGDDSQSIYAFRGANFENILRFPQFFPNCKVVKIEENYRSRQGILDFTNEIVANAKIGFQKRLYSAKYTGGKPVVKRFSNGTHEAEYIVNKLLEIRRYNCEYSDFAVLTRASRNSNFVQVELTKRGIPFIVVGGIRFSERRHIRDIVAFLKITINSLDAVAWHRILNLIEGIGKVRAKEIVNVIHSNSGTINFEKFSNAKYYNELCKLEQQFGEVIGKDLLPAQIIDELIIFYKPLLEHLEDDYEMRLKDLEVFSVVASKYDDMERFLADFTLEPPSNRFQNETTPSMDNDEEPLVVSTIHSAKGLEWHTVFIPFALDGVIPSDRALETIQGLEEERRIFYVAATRAKENLFITMPTLHSSWNAVFTKPSRFIAELDSSSYVIEK